MEKDSLSESEEYFESHRLHAVELFRIMQLELELHKRRLKSIRLGIELKKRQEEFLLRLTDDERKKAQEMVNQLIQSIRHEEELKDQIGVRDFSWIQEKEDKVLVLFDVQGRAMPNAVVEYPTSNRASIFVDIAASVQTDPLNLGHPIVLAAIERYVQALAKTDDLEQTFSPLSKNVARKRLRIILSAVEKSASIEKSKSIESHKHIQFLLSVNREEPYSNEYFNTVWHILKEPSSQTYKRRGLISNWLSRMKIRLNEEYPNIDHTQMLSFLKNSKKLPTRGGAKALKNAFDAFEQNHPVSSFKSYRSRSLKLLKDFAALSEDELQFSEEELNHISDEWLRKSLGIGAISNDLDLTETTLTWEIWS